MYKTETRIATFATQVGVGIEEAREIVSPLDGLTDDQFAAHTHYFVERKAFMQGKASRRPRCRSRVRRPMLRRSRPRSWTG